tara:strand:- start:676 stop:1581 length:906 start_codon:yes stop_codon:yes gene_type:complete
MLLKNIWLKLTNNQEYQKQKILNQRNKIIFEYKNKYEPELNKIRKKIKNQNELNFLHSGHAADIVNVLPVIKELSKKHKCNLFINLNKKVKNYYKHPAGKYYLNDKIFGMLFPLLKNQTYLNKVEKYSNQNIDINFDLLRSLPINLLFDNMTYASIITGIKPDISETFIEAPHNKKLKGKIIIQRTFRYRNDLIDYNFLNKFNDLFFVGTLEEFKDLKNVVKNLNFYDCKDFLDMASVVKSSKFVIANSSITFPLAEGLHVPRLLESSPVFPAAQPHGLNAYNFYFQSDFEALVNILNNEN